MTRLFDDKARKQLFATLCMSDLDYDGTAVRHMIVNPIKVSEARKYIATFHYSKTMPDSTRFAFAGYLNKTLCGVCVFGMGCGKNQYTSMIPDIENGKYIELTRLWCPDKMPKNTESKLISKSLSMLPKDIRLVLSFADESRGHVGTIYQASNWHYCGVNDGGKMIIDENGVVKHPRLIGIYKMRHPELKEETTDFIMKKYGFSYIEGGRKHRYVYLRGTKQECLKMYEQIKEKILPYPKQDKVVKSNTDKECFEEYLKNNAQNYQERMVFTE